MDLIFGPQKHQQSPQETILKLCDRVANSLLLEDRRASVATLRSMSRDWQLDVGTKAMTPLISVLKNDRMDTEIIKSALETFSIICTKPKKGEDLGLMFTEIFVKDIQNVHLLLDILAEVDFYVRFDCVRLLSALLHSAPKQVQDGILTSPMGIPRLIDLLDDQREIIRNEGLLLLIALTQSNADIQKIIAFENAFERLFTIIFDEGVIEGG